MLSGVDKRTSVLDYVVRSLYDKHEERVLDVIDDLQLVDDGAKLSGAETAREFDAVARNLAFLSAEHDRNQGTLDSHSFSSPTAKLIVSQFHLRLETYLERFRPQSAKLQRWREIMGRKIRETVDYFGEDSAACDTGKIFAVLQKFRNALIFCKESAEWKIYRSGAAQAAEGGSNAC